MWTHQHQVLLEMHSGQASESHYYSGTSLKGLSVLRTQYKKPPQVIPSNLQANNATVEVDLLVSPC